jgi:hypothetical protein
MTLTATTIVLATAFGAIAAGAALAQSKIENETLLSPLPQEFKIGYHAANDRETMAEYVPTGESVDDWSRMITVQVFHALKNADANAFAADLAKRWSSACPHGRGQRARTGDDHGYSFALWIYRCPLNPATQKPETMWLKVLSGADSLYSAQYAYRREFGKELAGPAMEYLRQIKVCDTRRADRPCPLGR